MKEQLISFKTAKLAKEKGFKNESCLKCLVFDKKQNKELELYYNETSPLHENFVMLGLLPTQSLLQKWLREKHNIQVYAYSYSVKGNKNGGKSFSDYIYVVNSLNDSKVIQSDVREELHQVYEEALEEGLCEALKLI